MKERDVSGIQTKPALNTKSVAVIWVGWVYLIYIIQSLLQPAFYHFFQDNFEMHETETSQVSCIII